MIRRTASAARASASARRRGRAPGRRPGLARQRDTDPSSATAASTGTSRRRVRSRRSAISWPVGSAKPARRKRGTSGRSERGGAHRQKSGSSSDGSAGSLAASGTTPWKERRWSGHGPSRASASEVRGGRVPLCCRKPYSGVAAVGTHHEGVAGDLREDGRGRHRGRTAIARDDRPLAAGHAGNAEVPVDEDQTGRQVESRERGAHRGPRRLQHVDHVDLPRSDATDRRRRARAARISRARYRRCRPLRSLESCSPSMGVVGSRITAAATTGPPGARAPPRPRPRPRGLAPRRRAPGRKRSLLELEQPCLQGTGAAPAHSGTRPRDCRPGAGAS